MGVETAIIIAGAAAAIGSIASASSAAANNRATLEQQEKMYNKQREDQLQDYNQRTGIGAQIRQYAEAGVNPAAVLGSVNSGSMSSVPSPPSAPTLENVGIAASTGITQTMQAIADLKGFQKQDAEVQNLLAQRNLTEMQSSYQKTVNYITEKYGDKKAGTELLNMYANTMQSFAEGRYKDSMISLNKVVEKLKGEEFKHMQTENSYLGLQLAEQLNLAKAMVVTEKEKAKTQKSQQAANYGAAEQSHAFALESGIRKAGLEFDNVVKQIDSEQAANTAIERLNVLVAKYKADENVSKKQALEAEKEATKLRERIKHYKEYPNAAKFDEFWDNFPIIGGLIKSLR